MKGGEGRGARSEGEEEGEEDDECVVDVLAVSAIFSLQDYPDGSVLQSNPRETVLKVGEGMVGGEACLPHAEQIRRSISTAAVSGE